MSDGYTKLFSSITDSTIWQAPDATRLVWITMLALADQNGYVGASVPGLASRARVSLEACVIALETFRQPDEWSRTPDYEGRRIVDADGGWILLNHAKYRAIRDAESRREQARVAMAKLRADRKAATVGDVSHGCPPLAQAEAEADQKKKGKSLVRQAAPDAAFELAWGLYPKRGGGNSKADALKAWTARRRDGWSDVAMVDGTKRYADYIRATGKERTEYVMQAARFFGPGTHFSGDWPIPVVATEAPSKSMQTLITLEAMKNGLDDSRDRNGHAATGVLEASGLPRIGHDSGRGRGVG